MINCSGLICRIKQHKYSAMLLVCVFFAALFILYGMTADLKSSRMPTEIEQVDFALKFGSGDLNPHHFLHPPFFSYVLFVLYAAMFLAGRLFGFFRSVNDFHLLYYTNISFFYMFARIVIFAVAIGSVFLVYKLAKEFFKDKNIALLASLFIIVSPLFITTAHYATGDMPLLFVSLAAFYFVARVLLKGGVVDYILAGLFTGFSIATKYNGGVLIIGLIAAVFLSRRPLKIEFQKFLLSFLFIIFGFFIGCPFAFLDYKTFLKDIVITFQRAKLDSYNFQSWKADRPGWLYIWTDTLPFGLGWFFMFLNIIAVLKGFFTRDRRVYLLIAMIVPYILYTGTWTMIKPRYYIHILPFMCILSAYIFYGLTGKIRVAALRTAFFVFILTAIVVQNSFAVIKFDNDINKTPVYLTAEKWIESNISTGEKISSSEIVPITPNEESIDRQLAEIRRKKIGEGVALTDLRNYLRVFDKKYNVYALPLPWMENFDREDFDFNALVKQGIKYFIIADEFNEYMNNPAKYSLQSDFLSDVKKNCRLAAEFKNTKPRLEPEDVGGLQEYVQIYRINKK